jgi:hypothetical protein
MTASPSPGCLSNLALLLQVRPNTPRSPAGHQIEEHSCGRVQTSFERSASQGGRLPRNGGASSPNGRAPPGSRASEGGGRTRLLRVRAQRARTQGQHPSRSKAESGFRSSSAHSYVGKPGGKARRGSSPTQRQSLATRDISADRPRANEGANECSRTFPRSCVRSAEGLLHCLAQSDWESASATTHDRRRGRPPGEPSAASRTDQ